MIDNKVSAVLTPEDRAAIAAAVQTLREKLPFLISLDPDERRSLLRLGDRSRAFVSQALELAAQHPDFLPRGFDLAEMRKDFELFQALESVQLELNVLMEKLDDTRIEAGNEAYTAALLIYQYAKTSGIALGGLEGAVDSLARRFSRKTRTAAPATPQATPAT